MISSDELVRRHNLWKQGEWDIPTEIDYSDFDFTWRPDPWDRPYIHEFGTQWQKTGGPRFVVPDAEGVKYNNTQRAMKLPDMTNWMVPQNIDQASFDFSWHPDSTEPPMNYEFGTQWQKTGGPVYKVECAQYIKYENAQTAIRTPNKRRWIILEDIEEDGFDFSWHPDSREQPYEYVFGNHLYSPENMPTLKYRVSGAQETKYCYDQFAKLIITTDAVEYSGSLCNSLKKHQFSRLFVMLTPDKKVKISSDDFITDGSIHIIDDVAAIIPRCASSHISYSIEDYTPVVKHYPGLFKQPPLDIIFLSNGESVADENYAKLLEYTRGLANRVVRIDGINGRVQSQHAAATASNTPWYFLVPAKLSVNPDFNWSWQPDRLSRSQHYIFTASNRVTGLTYGHMATIAYDRELVLKNPGRGLDFTLDDPHTGVDLLSGEAIYNLDPWTEWRTAFREAIKLKTWNDTVSSERLEAWLNSPGYSGQGARDAVEYFVKVNGDEHHLKLSYEWWWLRRLYCDKYQIEDTNHGNIYNHEHSR